MSSTASGYASLTETKRRLNKSQLTAASDAKIQDLMNEADNYVNIQISNHAITPIANPDAELISLASSLTAAIFNYWQTPIKERNLSGIKEWKQSIQDHIMTTYGKYNPSGLGGGDLYGTTRGFAPSSTR